MTLLIHPDFQGNPSAVKTDETFTASASSYFAQNQETACKAFSLPETSDTQGSDTNQWTTGTPSYENGVYSGTYSCCQTIVDGEPVSGEWLQLHCSRAHSAESFTLTANCWNPSRAPKSFVLAGSDGKTWTKLHSEENLAEWASKETRKFTISQKQAVKIFRLIVKSVHEPRESWLTIDKFKLYGNTNKRRREFNATESAPK